MPVKYLGSKKKLLPIILQEAGELFPALDISSPPVVADLFSGTARVGYAFKEQGWKVIANDLSTFGYLNALAYLGTQPTNLEEIHRHTEVMRSLPPEYGYFTETFCVRSRFFSMYNGQKIDACRSYLRKIRGSLDPQVYAALVVTLIEAADRVDSTVGVQMAYLKKYAARALQPLDLRLWSHTLPGASVVTQSDAVALSGSVKADLVYLDPPYNSHSYFGNYHIWETLARGDEPEVYGVACKRVDTKESKSDFTSKAKCLTSLETVVKNVEAPYVMVSFNNEGFIGEGVMRSMLGKYGDVRVAEIPYQRYVGAKIGIHNPEGVAVGKVKSTENTEFLYILNKKEGTAK